jgi:transcriptional accessory protein Tex/SPT6
MGKGAAPASVEDLYRQLACQRAGRAGALLARETGLEPLFAQCASALEDAAAVLLHAASAFMAAERPLPEVLSELAGALLAIAARFEEAADLARSPGGREEPGEADR